MAEAARREAAAEAAAGWRKGRARQEAEMAERVRRRRQRERLQGERERMERERAAREAARARAEEERARREARTLANAEAAAAFVGKAKLARERGDLVSANANPDPDPDPNPNPNLTLTTGGRYQTEAVYPYNRTTPALILTLTHFN